MKLKEALFLRDNRKKELAGLYNELLSYKRMPIVVNGENINVEEEKEAVNQIYKDIDKTLASIMDLSSKIEKAACDNGIKDLLTEVQLKRELLKNIKLYISNENNRYYDNTKIKAEQGIGIVKYDAILKEKFFADKAKLEKEVEELSLKIDKLNTETDI